MAEKKIFTDVVILTDPGFHTTHRSVRVAELSVRAFRVDGG